MSAEHLIVIIKGVKQVTFYYEEILTQHWSSVCNTWKLSKGTLQYIFDRK